MNMLSDDEVDDRLWDGAYKDGWRIVPRADAEGCARGTIRYTYVAPSGERLRSKTAAYAENEGTRLPHPATSDAQISPISAAAKQEARRGRSSARTFERPRPPGARARGRRTARPKRAPSGGRARGRRPDRFHPSRRPGEQRKGRKRGAWPGRIRGGSTFSWEFFGWMFQISVHIHTPPPGRNGRNGFQS